MSRPYDKESRRDSSWAMAPVPGGSCLIPGACQGPRRQSMPIMGMACLATPIISPRRKAAGGFRAMQAALKQACITRHDLDYYINAHGTLDCSSVTRSSLAPCIGCSAMAVGRIRSRCRRRNRRSAIFLVLPVGGADGFRSRDPRPDSTPTLNTDNSSVETSIDLVPHQARKREEKFVLSNSFGFGGTIHP